MPLLVTFISIYYFYLLFLFPIPRNTINNIVPSTVPTTRETIYINGFDIAPLLCAFARYFYL